MAGISTTQAILGGLRGFADKLRSNKTYDQYFPQKRPVNAQDAYFNTATGVGTGRDKAAYGAWTYGPDLADIELEDLYANNDLAATIVEKIVEDALRDGFSIQREGSTPEADAELTKQILARFVELQGGEYRFLRGAVWGRLFGGGGLILGLRGAGALARPLSKDKVKRVEFIKDFDKQQIQPWTWDAAGMPETYLYTPVVYGWTTDIAQPVEVHRDRIIFFPGARTTTSKRRERQGWDLSVLQRVKAALKSFDGMFASTDAMFADASQAVFKLQGLIQSLAEQDGTDDVQTRFQLMDVMRSSTKAIMLDAGDEMGKGAEDFKVVDRASLGTLDGVIDKYYIRLAAAARMPLTVLLGMSPAGMDATGESDLILYYNTVDVYRKQVLQERLLLLIKLIYTELENSTPEASSTTRCRWSPKRSPRRSKTSVSGPSCGPSCRARSRSTWRPPRTCASRPRSRWSPPRRGPPEEVALNMDIIAPTWEPASTLRRAARRSRPPTRKSRTVRVGQGQLEAQSEVETNSQIKVAKAKPPAGKMSERKTPSKAAKRQV
jgi:phage-related protein (TIGR01555 family)